MSELLVLLIQVRSNPPSTALLITDVTSGYPMCRKYRLQVMPQAGNYTRRLYLVW